jgi:deoxyribodipyrimidine photo-lyase
MTSCHSANRTCNIACSPRLVLDRANQKGGSHISKTFMRRLVWRDLSYWLLHHWPQMPSEPMRPHYADQVQHDSQRQ